MRKLRFLVALWIINFLIYTAFLLLNFLGNQNMRNVELFTVTDKPNIVLFVADDYGWNDIGYHGSEIRTPTLDKLAQQGVKLENYYVQPMCSPSRSQLLSGRYQIHTGLQHRVISYGQPDGLPLQFPTLADKLKEAGYSTHIVGKWHIGFYTQGHIPTSRGFDTFYGHLNDGGGYYNHTQCNGDMCGYDLWENTTPTNNTEGTYSTHRFTTRAVDIINKHDQRKPLFLYLPFKSVHKPLEVPSEYLTQYRHIQDEKRRIYAGMVACMDEAAQNITHALKKSGLWSNTVFIFTTDNGGRCESGGNNWPLRGAKSQLWEGGIRAVGFVTSPLLNSAVSGSTSRALIHISDWYPTLVNLARGSLTGPGPLDGVDQWETINGGPSARTEILHNIDPLTQPRGKPRKGSAFNTTITAAMRYGDWKILTGFPGRGKWIPPPTNSSLKTIALKETEQNLFLFNITADPLEQTDISKRYPKVVQKLLRRLREYELTAVKCPYPKKDYNADPKLHGGYWVPWLES